MTNPYNLREHCSDKSLSKLLPLEMKIIRLYYGIMPVEFTLDDIAKNFSMSRASITKILREGVNKLKDISDIEIAKRATYMASDERAYRLGVEADDGHHWRRPSDDVPGGEFD